MMHELTAALNCHITIWLTTHATRKLWLQGITQMTLNGKRNTRAHEIAEVQRRIIMRRNNTEHG